jgi:hypothetical protein
MFAMELPTKGACTMMDWIKELPKHWKGAMKMCRELIE